MSQDLEFNLKLIDNNISRKLQEIEGLLRTIAQSVASSQSRVSTACKSAEQGIDSITKEAHLLQKDGAQAFETVAQSAQELRQEAQTAGQSVENVADTVKKKVGTISLLSAIQGFQMFADAMDKLSEPMIGFEQSMHELSSITGIVGKDLKDLEEKAREFGISSALGAKAVAQSYAVLASQIQVSKIGMKGLNELQDKTLTLADAGMMQANDAAMALTGTINQFGLEAEEAGRVINVLAAGSKYGAANISELSESFKATGAVAAGFGVSLEQTAGALEVLAKNNMKGAESGTALRNIMVMLEARLGQDLGEIGIVRALKNVKGELKTSQDLVKAFGRQNLAAAQFLLQNVDAIEEMTTAVTDTNVATEQATINTDTWQHSQQVAKARLDDLLISVSNATGGFMPFVATMGQMLVPFSQLIPMLSMMKSALPYVTQGITATAKACKTFALSLRGVRGAMAGLSIAGAIAGAVALLANALKESDQEATRAKESFERMQDTLHQSRMTYATNKQEVDKYIQTLATFKGSKEEEKALITTLNSKYGESLGTYQRLQEWKEKLTASGEAYCRMLEQEALTQTLAEKQAQAQVALLEAEEARKKKRNELEKEYNIMLRARVYGLKTDKQTNVAISKKVSEYVSKQIDTTEEGKAYAKAKEDTANYHKWKIQAEKNLQDRIKALQAPNTANSNQATKAVQEIQKEANKLPKRLHPIKGEVALAYRIPSTKEALKAQEKAQKVLQANAPKGVISIGTNLTDLQKFQTHMQQTAQKMAPLLDVTNALGATIGNISGALGEQASQWANWATQVISSIAQALPQIVALFTASSAAATAEASLSVAGIPVVGAVAALSTIAAMVAAFAKVPKLADGGIAYGTTYAMVGEYAGAANNPEVIAPLNKLREIIQPHGNSSAGGTVSFRIRGRDLVGVLQNEKHRRQFS